MKRTITIIDCDFFNHIIETSQDINILKNIITDLNLNLVMHEFVYEQELLIYKSHASSMIESGLMKIARFDDFINPNIKN